MFRKITTFNLAENKINPPSLVNLDFVSYIKPAGIYKNKLGTIQYGAKLFIEDKPSTVMYTVETPEEILGGTAILSMAEDFQQLDLFKK